MKRPTIWLFLVVFLITFASAGIGCKSAETEATETTTAFSEGETTAVA